MSARDVPALLFCVWCVWALHQPDARGGAEGGCYRHEYDDGEVDDFLPKFFLHKLKINFFLVIQMTGGRKDLVADIGISVMPSLKGTTFCTLPVDDLLMWDEYRDW